MMHEILKINYFLKTLIVIYLSVISNLITFGQNTNNYNEFTAGLDTVKNRVMEKLKIQIPKIVESEQIPGVGIVLVDDKRILWSEYFGNTRKINGVPVNHETLFALMSCSKSILALGVLLAVQDGLLDLDEPIIKYLPNFKLKSRFENFPEQKITLRLILCHRAGFENDTYCPGLDSRAHSLEEYFNYVSDTWLNFPVNYRYYYSNLGFEVAGYILEKKSKISFWKYIQKKIFIPLGMKNTTYNIKSIKETKNRAVGHWAKLQDQDKNPPFYIPMIACGGCYSNLDDMVKYIQFHLNEGKMGGKRIIGKDLFDLMHHIAFPFKNQRAGSTLGMDRGSISGSYFIYQEGGGYGFESGIIIYPELNMGIVFLANSCWTGMNVQNIAKFVQEVADSLLNRKKPFSDYLSLEGYTELRNDNPYIKSIIGIYDKNKRITLKNGKYFFEKSGKEYPLTFYLLKGNLICRYGINNEIRFLSSLNELPGNLELINLKDGNIDYAVFHKPDPQFDKPGPDNPGWKKYIGTYNLIINEISRAKFVISIEDKYLNINGMRSLEYKPGLFFNPEGTAFDFRSSPYTVANFPLTKINN